MKTVKEINEYLEKNYFCKKYKNGIRIHWIFDNTKQRLKNTFNKEYDNEKEYFCNLYIDWKYFNIDKVFLENENIDLLFNQAINWIENHRKQCN